MPVNYIYKYLLPLGLRAWLVRQRAERSPGQHRPRAPTAGWRSTADTGRSKRSARSLRSLSSAARDLLAPVCGWFTEGFDTADLAEAKTFLIELARGASLGQSK